MTRKSNVLSTKLIKLDSRYVDYRRFVGLTRDLHKSNEYEVHWSGYASKRIHGVRIVIKVDPSIEIVEVIPVDARIIVVDLIVRGCSLKVINCYEESTASSKTSFYRTLNKQFKSVKKKQKVICLGDFNATTSAAWSNTSLREGSIIDDLIVNDNGERFHEFFGSNKLSVLNIWFTHKKCRRITYGIRQTEKPKRCTISFSVQVGFVIML